MLKESRSRPGWDEYFLEVTNLISSRSTCRRRKVGAILVRDRRILATGYNGAPTGLRHCLDIGCLRDDLKIPSGQNHELCRGIHAEQNAIIQAALHGVSIGDATLYCNIHPCIICAKMIVNAGVSRVVVRGSYAGYGDPLAEDIDIFKEAGIPVETL